MLHHDPTNDFHVHTFHGRFEDAVDQIMKVVGSSFSLSFIDPTGWTGYEFHKIAKIMQHKPGEVLLNYMFDFINRFTASADAKTEASFDGILGANWAKRMDQSMPRDVAIQALFAEQFKSSGDFNYVLSTPIEKLSDRTHFSIVYGTRSAEGLSAYRDVEFAALKDHGMRRLDAKLALEQSKTGQYNMFSSVDLQPASAIEDQVAGQCVMARAWLLAALRANGSANFEDVWPPLLEQFMVRRTDAKRICAELAKERIIRESWKDGSSKRRTPDDDDPIELLAGLPSVR